MRADVRGLSAHVVGHAETVFADWHLIMSVVFTHVSPRRPNVHEGAPSTLPAYGIGSGLATCVPEAQRFVTQGPISQWVGRAVQHPNSAINQLTIQPPVTKCIVSTIASSMDYKLQDEGSECRCLRTMIL